jgi:RNA polymerase sigma-70 factor (sigma-E family)
VRADAEDQFRRYCEEYLSGLLRLGFVLTGDREAARDLVQTALARTFAAWDRVARRDDPGPYVRRTMINCLLNERRRDRGREVLVAEVLDRVGAYDVAAVVEARVSLLRALQRLPPRQRAVVVLRYCEDRSESEVASLLGCSTGTVKSQAAKGLTKLRAAAESQEVPG